MWDLNKSLEASARLRSNTGLHAKRTWKRIQTHDLMLCCPCPWPRARQSVARGVALHTLPGWCWRLVFSISYALLRHSLTQEYSPTRQQVKFMNTFFFTYHWFLLSSHFVFLQKLFITHPWQVMLIAAFPWTTYNYIIHSTLVFFHWF